MESETVAIIIPCLPRDLPYLNRAVTSAVRQEGEDNVVLVRVAQEPLPVALNTLIRSTTADLIVRLDADDWLSGNAIEQFREAILYDAVSPIIYARRYYEVVDERIEIKEMDLRDPLGANCMFRRDIWSRVGGYDESLSHQEALDFKLRVDESWGHPVRMVDGPLYYYNRRARSLSSETEAIERDRQKVLARYENRRVG